MSQWWSAGEWCVWVEHAHQFPDGSAALVVVMESVCVRDVESCGSCLAAAGKQASGVFVARSSHTFCAAFRRKLWMRCNVSVGRTSRVFSTELAADAARLHLYTIV